MTLPTPKVVVRLAAALVPLTVISVPQAQAASAPCEEFTVTLTSVHNPSTQSRLLTQFDDEVLSSAQWGFTANEGPAFAVAPAAGAGLIPIWRAYNTSTHDFTWAAEGADLHAVVAVGYEKQFVQFFASAVKNTCTEAVYRATKGDATRLVHGDLDREAAIRDGWTISREAFRAAAVKSTTRTSDPARSADNGDQFTIAVIPDTQLEISNDRDTRMRNRSQWIVENARLYDIEFVTHVGDMVDWGAVAPEQFARAKRGMAPLSGEVAWSATIGNHDTAAVCPGGSACPGADASVTVRDTEAFNAAFPASTFTRLSGQFESGRVDNAFHTFAAQGQNWLMLNLELWPRDSAVAWANSVVEAHPRHNVIVSTHAYLDSNGSIGQTNGGYGSTSPQYLYDNLIKRHPNIVMVLSGHTGSGATRVDTGVNGNRIVSLLQTYHSPATNPTRLISFDVSEGSITHWVFAPFTNEMIEEKRTVNGLDLTP